MTGFVRQATAPLPVVLFMVLAMVGACERKADEAPTSEREVSTMPEENMQEAVARAEAALNRVREAWMAQPAINGVDIGFLYRDGVMTRDVGIRVFVDDMAAIEALTGTEALPETLDDIPVTVIQSTSGPE